MYNTEKFTKKDTAFACLILSSFGLIFLSMIIIGIISYPNWQRTIVTSILLFSDLAFCIATLMSLAAYVVFEIIEDY